MFLILALLYFLGSVSATFSPSTGMTLSVPPTATSPPALIITTPTPTPNVCIHPTFTPTTFTTSGCAYDPHRMCCLITTIPSSIWFPCVAGSGPHTGVLGKRGGCCSLSNTCYPCSPGPGNPSGGSSLAEATPLPSCPTVFC